MKQPPNKSFKMVPPPFKKILDNITCAISQPGYLKPFRPLFVKKTNSCWIDRKSVRFELHVHDLMLIIFWKNHFLFHNMIFHQRSTASLKRLGPELRIFMPVVLIIIETGIRNSKNDRNNVKPSRGVILCHIVTIKILKLEYCKNL